MSEIDPHAHTAPVDWSELGVSGFLPTGTVTLLLADVEGSTRLWETQPGEMTAAVARLNQAVSDIIATHDGVRPVEQGEGDSFVVAFARVGGAVACALDLQRAPLEPIRLRIGVHTGDVQLRDEGNYIGPTINRTARLRDLAHGGQTVLSGATSDLVVDAVPAGAWLTDLGTHPLRDLPRPERVVQLCHPDLPNEFPPLRVSTAVVSHNLPVQLTSFVGRDVQMTQLRGILAENRLVTLTGAGGVGKTRLAVHIAAELADQFDDGVRYVDLAPITVPEVVPVTVARVLGLPDQPGRSTMDTLVRFVRDRQTLVVLDNCEHLLDASAALAVALLGAAPRLTLLATSREPLGVTGEVTWQVPSLSLADEAIELFADRARLARPDFTITEDAAADVAEICRRLDGMPLAIELAAARVRALSVRQIVDSLHDRFRLLTGGARTAVRRQQTLRASVDWSHALLTEPEQVLFRRLAVFSGDFDLDAAQAVGASREVETYQLMDQLSLLVDKSLVVADDTGAGMRYRLLETVRQYAQEKLGESGEADEVRGRHRDHYTAIAAELESHGHTADDRLLAWAQTEIDNLRTAFAWSRENSDPEAALRLILSLRPLWLRGGRVQEALAGLDTVLADPDHSGIAPAVWAAAVAEQSILAAFAAIPTELGRPREALEIAREIDDPALIAPALTACGMSAIYNPELAQQYLAEAIDVARAAGDRWSLCQILSYQATVGDYAGEPIAAIAAAQEGRDLADALGDRFFSRTCRFWLSIALAMHGDLAQACQVARALVDEAEAAADHTMTVFGHVCHAAALFMQGHAAAAHAAAQSAQATAATIGGFFEDTVYVLFANAALAGGDAPAARLAAEEALRRTVPTRELFIKGAAPVAEAA